MKNKIGNFQTDEKGNSALPVIDVTAALLALTGTAWTGDESDIPVPRANAVKWQKIVELPEGRVIQIDLVGQHQDFTQVEVRQSNGWNSPYDGKHYGAGEIAPMRRVFYHLDGHYKFLRNGVATKSIRWNTDDFNFWFDLYHQRSLSIDIKSQVEWRNKLLDLNRRAFGISSTTPQPGRTRVAEDVWENL